MPADNAPIRGHKRSRSSADLTKDQINELSAVLDDLERRVKELKNSQKWGDIEEVQQLSKETAGIFAQVKQFKEIKSVNPDAVVVSLSNMDFDTLKFRMGVSDAIVVNAGPPETFLAGIGRALRGYQGPCDLNIILNSVKAWDCSPLFNLLKICETNMNNKSEAASRIIIDPWIISGMQIIETIEAAHGHYIPVLFPELLVWRMRSQSDTPAIIEHDGKTTYLSGSIDYVSLNYHLTSNLSDERKWQRDIDIKEIVNGENAARALRIFTSADTFTICEAKRRSNNKLDEHEPQVVAECLALLSKLKADSRNKTLSTTKVGFTLTTGVAWIFGLVDAKERRYLKTTEIKIDVTKQGDTEKNIQQSLRALMALMLIWGTQSSNVLETIMTALASSRPC